MSFETIIFTIFLLSLLGLVILIFRKIPILVSLPAVAGEGFISKIKSRIKETPGFKNFSFEIFLQKIISQIRVLSLKTDHKTFNWLKTLRAKTQKKKLEDGKYWEEIKNSTDLKK